MNDFKDFHTVKDLRFDVKKLRTALNEVLKIKKYDTANGIKNFAAICLNQIPGNPDSTKGNYARGIYWTKPNQTGKEAIREDAKLGKLASGQVESFRDLTRQWARGPAIFSYCGVGGMWRWPLNSHPATSRDCV